MHYNFVLFVLEGIGKASTFHKSLSTTSGLLFLECALIYCFVQGNHSINWLALNLDIHMKITCECLILSTEKCFCSTNTFVPGFKLKLVTFSCMYLKSSTVPVKIFTKKIHQSYPQQLFSLWYMRELTWSEVRNHTTIKGQ